MTTKKNCVNIYSLKMKKHKLTLNRILSLFLLSFTILSCSDSRNEELSEGQVKTIKSSVSDMENQMAWSVELEGDRLSKKTDSFSEYIAEGKNLTKDNVKILKNLSDPLYPGFTDFASLDISAVEIRYLDFANTVSNNILSFDKEALFEAFSANYRFNCIFFINAVEKKWKERAGDKEKVSFDRYILGQPFKNENLLQFPVRFYCNMGYVDVTLYMNSNEGNSLYNLKIEKWEIYE